MKEQKTKSYAAPSIRIVHFRLDENFCVSQFQNSETEVFDDGGDFGW